MDPSAAIPRVVVVLGPPRSHWPEPLATLLRTGQIILQTASTIYQAAGQLSGATATLDAASPPRPILLLDPQMLLLRDLHAARLIMSKFATTIALLPLTPAASPCARQAATFHVMTWEEALPTLQGISVPAIDQTPAALTCPTPMPDNPAALGAADSPGNSVTWDAALRYDEPGTQPVVSEQEIQALLGTPE